MEDLPARQRSRGSWLISLVVLVLGTTAAGAYFYLRQPAISETSDRSDQPKRSYGTQFQTQYFCSQCHAHPRPDILPKSAWRQEVEQAYKFFADSKLTLQA